MKKLLSLLMATVMTASLFATTAFAATPNASAVFSTTEVTEGETFTVTIKTAEQTIYFADLRLTFDDFSKFEVVSTLDAQGRDRHRLAYEDEWGDTYYQTLDEANLEAGNGISFSYLGSKPVTYKATTVAVVTLKALKAGTYTINLVEDTEYADDDTGFKGTAATQQIVVKSAAPVLDEAIEVGATSTDDAEAGTRTWAVEVGADLIANGKIKAVLTNSHDDVAADNTQEVALSFGTVDKDSEMDCQFNVVVKFQDYAKYAATTNLDIVKAN